MTICFFVGYKYEGGGYRVWDPKRRVVVESRDLIFFEDGLLPPTLNDSRPQPIDEDDNPHLTTPPNRRRCQLSCVRSIRADLIVHGLTGGNARQWTNDGVLGEKASCGMQRRIR